MNIQETIEKYCPDGVNYYPLATIFNMRNGYTPSKSNPDFWTNGTIDWFRMEDIRAHGHVLDSAVQKVTESAVKGQLFKANSIILATSATIGEHALVTVDCLANQRFTFFTVKDSYKDDINMRFMNYYFDNIDEWCKSHLNKGNFASVDMDALKRHEIPVPPLPVQEEIVRILDKFTELEAELDMRKRQYEYYRDKMLLNADYIEWIPIGELGDIIRGKRFVHKDDTEEGVPAIHYGELYTHYGTSATNTKTHIRNDLASKMRYAHTGDVVIVGAGENKVDIGVGVAWMGDEAVAVHDACFILTNHGQNPKYISYCLRTEDYHRKLFPFVSEGKICSFLKDGLAQVTLPIPKDRKTQDKIVEILDKFSTLTEDISEGLPAEIKMRHQQYEYYRDKLLNFKRLEVAANA